MTPAQDPAFAALTRRISDAAGLTLDAYKDKCVQRRIAVRMRACGVHTYGDYMELLGRMPGEFERLKDALTINVTRFYRNPEAWARLADGLLRSVWLLDAPLRCWSAGCASGEEAYSLAMLAGEVASAAGRPDALERVRVDATDIDRTSLARARAARYRAEALAELPAEVRARWLVPDGPEFRVAEPIRQRVTITARDLLRESPPANGYQLIACRNVIIYFDRPMQERLFAAFADALVPGGLLLLGKVETLFGPARHQLTPVDPRERIFRRDA
ncbi:MAG TPA: protein-glutamate O-methyltransferase CheR [Gemmatimonadales bacterium]|nr:protein-glutamate O-methyltransferase CheR [Gemmatimonadales bacterium]